MIKDKKGQAFAADFAVFEFSETVHFHIMYAHSKKTVHDIIVASAGYVLSSTVQPPIRFYQACTAIIDNRFKQSTENNDEVQVITLVNNQHRKASVTFLR